MASRTTYVDDIDGSPADERMTFSFDGVSYEIDLASHNLTKLRAELMAWAETARRVNAPSVRSVLLTGPDALRLTPAGDEGAAIRQWGRDHGFEVAPRGPLSYAVTDAFNRSKLVAIVGSQPA